MRRVLLIACTAAALLLVVSVIVVRQFGKGMRSSFESALSEMEAGPLEKPSPLAASYGDRIAAEASVVSDGKLSTIECTITNKGDRSLRQIVCQVNLRDGQGNLVSCEQGPVIRTIREEEGTIVKTVRETHIGNSFSEQAAPIPPAGSVSFSVRFDLGQADVSMPLAADVEVMDLEFWQ